MESTIKNILIVLVVLSIAFLGYYFYAQQDSTVQDDSSVTTMLANTEVFIGRSQELDRIGLDMTLFEDKRFTSLQSFTKPVDEKLFGRTDPFAAADSATQ